jgi:peptidyl-prolyl cis-trans isomerase D
VKWGAVRSVSRREAQGLPAPVLEAVVTADTSKLPAYAGVPVAGSGYVLLKITKVVDAGPQKERAPELEARAESLYGSAQYDAYIASLRSRADISVKPENLDRK